MIRKDGITLNVRSNIHSFFMNLSLTIIRMKDVSESAYVAVGYGGDL